MPAYLITITMPDGSQGTHHGIYDDGFVASTSAHQAFPEAKRVSARPLVRLSDLRHCLRPLAHTVFANYQDTLASSVARATEGAPA